MTLIEILYRMIIYPLELLFEVIFSVSEKLVYNPELSIYDDFMVNAVVPYMASYGLIEDQRNPITGNSLTLDFLKRDLLIINSDNANTGENPGNRYAPADWYRLIGVCDTLNGGNWEDIQIEPVEAP